MPAYSEKSRRILALEFPMLALDRIKRNRKRLGETSADLPLVVVAKIENTLQLTAVDECAVREGLHPGLPLADARARVPALDVVEADDVADIALLEAIADWCDRFTPLVAINRPYGLYLDISGCAHLFGGEAKMLHIICDFLHRQEIDVQAAIAGTAVAANTLARGASGSIIENGKEKDAVSALPVSVLGIDEKIVHALKRAGLKTIGEVASRSSSELTARFGAGFCFLLMQALGRNGQPIIPRRALPDYVAERRFAEPVATSEVIGRIIASLAATLQSLLEERGQGARRFESSFFRTDGAVRHIALDVGRPLRDAAAIGTYYAERLEVLADPVDPGFGFDLIRLAALATEKLEYSSVAFQSWQDERQIADLIDRLSARFGPSRVTRFLSVDTHVPEYAAAFCPAQRGTNPSPWPQLRLPQDTPRRPLHMLSPPEPIESKYIDVPDGPPKLFVWRRATHEIVRSEGPERIAMEWWRDLEAKTRDYFQVEDKGGRRFWLYRDGFYERDTAAPRWFMHGLFA
ncbi:MAG: DNA polymerase Y family protein [Xanthobacteraceae bacterium]|nr:DNA polymerase Y family protein [Xanthobacteraceae bacterium]QYK46679.1 MAG: DNA polymerase Y family protein [Xanthobacteraceae bacterium]